MEWTPDRPRNRPRPHESRSTKRSNTYLPDHTKALLISYLESDKGLVWDFCVLFAARSAEVWPHLGAECLPDGWERNHEGVGRKF